MEPNELKKDFFISLNFEGLISSSNAPSSTIKIKPSVPRMGSSPERSGTVIEKKLVISLTPHPKISNRITEGILVRAEDKSNKYPIKSRTHIIMITVIVINNEFQKNKFCPAFPGVMLQYKMIFLVNLSTGGFFSGYKNRK